MMWGFRTLGGAALLSLAFSTAQAAPFTKSNVIEQNWRTGVSLVEGATHQTPRGFARLCEARPELCPEYRTRYEVSKVTRVLARNGGAEAARPQRQMLDKARLEQLKRVNETVNSMIRPRREGTDTWELSSSVGDCEEYALMKREVLASLGWARSSLRIAAAKTEDGEDHAVLIVRTVFEDLVLDNLNDEVRGLGATTHRYIAAESFEKPGRWVSVSVQNRGASARPARVANAAPRAGVRIDRRGKTNRLNRTR